MSDAYQKARLAISGAYIAAVEYARQGGNDVGRSKELTSSVREAIDTLRDVLTAERDEARADVRRLLDVAWMLHSALDEHDPEFDVLEDTAEMLNELTARYRDGE